MKYIELRTTGFTNDEEKEILIAFLGDIGFDSFVEQETELLAYIPEKDFSESSLMQHEYVKNVLTHIRFSFQAIAEKNWNQEWESNYQPVNIENQCQIRAPFHEKIGSIPFDIIIEPKMSFGTAHHPTTSMMIKAMLEMDFTHKKVLDMGCGTGVLAILAALKGANEVIAIDNDEWAYNNTVENIKRNNVTIAVYLDDAKILQNFNNIDVCLANINRNILLEDIKHYSLCTSSDSLLLLSGFYKEDLNTIEKECTHYGYFLVKVFEQNNWVAALFKKTNT